MTTAYTPRPGSLAQKVMDYLQTGEGAQISPAAMVTSFKVKPSSTSNLLKAPLKFGVLERHKNGKQTLYTLPGVKPVWDDAAEAAAPSTAPKARKVKAPKKKAAPPPRHPEEAPGRSGAGRTRAPGRDRIAVGRRRRGAGRHHDQQRCRQRDAERSAGAPGAPLPGAGVWAHGVRP